jgi:hypothetical protein
MTYMRLDLFAFCNNKFNSYATIASMAHTSLEFQVHYFSSLARQSLILLGVERMSPQRLSSSPIPAAVPPLLYSAIVTIM